MISLRYLLVSIVCAFCFLTSACTQHQYWSKRQCLSTNLATQGLADGRSGKPQDAFNDYAADCAKFQIDLESDTYNTAWQQGNQDFCESASLFQQGKINAPYPLVCPSTALKRKHYRRGLKVYSEMTSLQQQVDRINETLYPHDNLQKRYDQVLTKMSEDREDMRFFKSGYSYGHAYDDLLIQEQKAKMIRLRMSRSNTDSLLDSNSRYRDHLLLRKEQLLDRLTHLKSLQFL